MKEHVGMFKPRGIPPMMMMTTFQAQLNPTLHCVCGEIERLAKKKKKISRSVCDGRFRIPLFHTIKYKKIAFLSITFTTIYCNVDSSQVFLHSLLKHFSLEIFLFIEKEVRTEYE